MLNQPVGISRSFSHRGKRYRLQARSIETLALIKEILRSPECQFQHGLLAMRPRIRKAIARPAVVTLCCVIETTDDTRLLRLALWMVGRIGNRYAVESVLTCVRHPAFRVRRSAVRSLKQLHAWTELRRVADNDPDVQIRELAEPSSPRPYDDRLARFVAATASLEPSHHLHPLVISPEAEIGAGRPPKSEWRIRLVLRRIHRLVEFTRRRPRWYARGDQPRRCFTWLHG